ncbi:hypothetical protein IMZ48_08225 [Candidatus Bathyarchaeota archaeon]|nr:hypothetical protein [Candidatus Bathyarchaeota archaeon]
MEAEDDSPALAPLSLLRVPPVELSLAEPTRGSFSSLISWGGQSVARGDGDGTKRDKTDGDGKRQGGDGTGREREETLTRPRAWSSGSRLIFPSA